MPRITDVVKNLLFINVIVFFARMTLPQFVPELSMFSPLSANFQPYQLVTHFFMHANPQHLIFNMLTLFFLGPMVEQTIGAKRFLILYLLSALGAFIAHFGVDYYTYQSLIGQIDPADFVTIRESGRELILQGRNYSDPRLGAMNALLNIPIVGASGAIYGVVIAFATLHPNARLMLLFPPIPIKAKYLAFILLGIDLFSGISNTSSGIAHFAHLGGALVGFLLIRYWYKGRKFS